MKFFSAFLFIVPVLVLFWQKNGLSLTEIMVLQSLYALFIVILEVPSGYLADRVGRKKVLVVATIMYFLWQLMLALGTWFWEFLVSEMLFAFALSFMSWADSAFLYDSLQELGREKEYKKIRWNVKFVFLGAAAVAQILWGILAKYGIRSWEDIFRQVAILWPIFVFFAIPISLSLYEPIRHKLVIEKGYLRHLHETLKKELRTQKTLRGVMVLFVFLAAGVQFALWFYQPYFLHIGVDIFYFWFIFGGFQLFTALVSKYAEKIEQRLWMMYLLIVSIVLVCISYLGMAMTWAIWWLLFCLFQQFVRGIYGIVVSDYIHQRVSSTYRATIQSIQNLWKNVVYALFLPFFGRVADVYSLTDALWVIGITVSVILIPLFVFLKDKIRWRR